GIAQRALPQAQDAELERGSVVPRRIRRRLRLPLAPAERADVQASGAVAHQTDDGLVDDDSIDDETAPQERQEAQPHAEPARREEGLGGVEGRVVADRHRLERNPEAAPQAEADALGADISPERVPRRAQQPVLLAAREGGAAG